MATITQQLNQLQQDKQNLTTKLSEKGVEVTGNETFTQLIPKLDEIQSEKFAPFYITFREYKGTENFNNFEGLDTSKIRDMSSMFYNANDVKEIIIDSFDTSNVESLRAFCQGCTSLVKLILKNFDTSKVQNLSHFVVNDSKLEEIDLSSFNTAETTNFQSMFFGCSKLVNLDLGHFDMSKANVVDGFLYRNSALKNLKFPINFGKGFIQKTTNYSSYTSDLSGLNSLTYESIMSVVNNIYDLNLTYDVANGGTLYTQSLRLGTTNKAKLTAEEIAIATSKGWTVS